MPTLDPRFIQVPPLQDYFVDKDTGFPLSAGIVTFYEDNDHTVLKPVYQLTVTPSNTYVYNPLTNPLQLSSVGTFMDENGNDIVPYFFPFDGTPTATNNNVDLYFITVFSSAGVMQFTRDAWPNFFGTGMNGANLATTENLLSNPQFSVVNFSTITPPSGVVFNVSGANLVTNIAPDWDLVTSGTGTVTVKQIPSTIVGLPSNAPYLLDINSTSSSLTSLQLRQRLSQDPRLLAGAFANGYLVVGSQDGGTHQIIMSYVPSNPIATSYQLINQVSAATGYTSMTGTVPINGVINTDSPLTPGFVDILITIPVAAHIQLTSIQLVGVPTGNTTATFIEQTTQRELDHLFHYYNAPLQFKPIRSYLVGWDFPLNPAQANGSSVAAFAAHNGYTWDQTILYQSVISSINTSRTVKTGELLLTSADATNLCQLALIQYLPSPIVNDMLENRLSCNVQGSTNNPGGLIGTVSLWYTNSTVPPTLPLSVVTTLDANGHPSAIAAGWTEILRDFNVGNAQFLLGAALTNFGFNGWDATGVGAPTTAGFFAIVIGTAAITNTSTIAFNSISLVPGDIPTIPSPQTLNEVLDDCQVYYEKSYESITVPTTVTARGSLISPQTVGYDGTNLFMNLTTFYIPFKTEKWLRPGVNNLATYSPATGAMNKVYGVTYLNGASNFADDIPLVGNFTLLDESTKAAYFASATTANFVTSSPGGGGMNPFAFLEYQWVVDVRPGV
jgi:hypothetical protein